MDQKLVAALAAVQGVTLAPERAEAIAAGLAPLRPVLEAMVERLAFEDEPAGFVAALEAGRGD
jgi:hypothetical protein